LRLRAFYLEAGNKEEELKNTASGSLDEAPEQKALPFSNFEDVLHGSARSISQKIAKE